MLNKIFLFFVFFNSTFALSSVFDGKFTNGYHVSYLNDSFAGYRNPQWMRNLPDQTQLSEISIPGTHNSLSRFGGDIPKTQSLNTQEQLLMGIRYFDVRFDYYNGELHAYHDIFPQHITFDSFLNEVDRFLTMHPSEIILIRMISENNKQTAAFNNRLNEIITKYINTYYEPILSNFTVGEARGKYVMVPVFHAENSPHFEKGNHSIQDKHRFNTNWDLYPKWDYIKAQFERIQHSNKISLNYLSGSGGSFPYFVASGQSSHGTHHPLLWTGIVSNNRYYLPDFPRRSCVFSLCSVYFLGTNQLTTNWINAENSKGRTFKLGIVLSDLPGGSLVDLIIKNNERLL